MLTISILIPVVGYKDIKDVIQSLLKQQCNINEIIILRNCISELRYTKNYFYSVKNIFIKEIFLSEKGKANALNIGLKEAKGDLIVVVDADCILDDLAIPSSIKYFENESVIALGGRLCVLNNDDSLLTKIQNYEYIKTFQVQRRIWSKLNAYYLVSGAFSIFRKSELLKVGGFDSKTVGEDMEIILRLQNTKNSLLRKNIIYEPKAICYTKVPNKINKLFFQRDRWQRGLIDCIIKYFHMMFNPSYGLLGMIAFPYQLIIGIINPAFSTICLIYSLFNGIYIKSFYFISAFLVKELIIGIVATYLEVNKDIKKLLIQISYVILMTLISIPYQSFITLAKLFGTITYPYRKNKW